MRMPLLLPCLPQLHIMVDDWAETYGDCYRLSLPSPGICVSDTPTIMAVLQQRPGTFSREAGLCEMVINFGFRGVFTARGEEWKRYRRLTAPHFSRPNVRNMVKYACDMAAKLCSNWAKHADASEAFDCMAGCALYALDVGCLAVMGRDVGALDGARAGRDALRLKDVISARLCSPLPLYRLFRDDETEAAKKRFDSLVIGLIDEYRKQQEATAAPANGDASAAAAAAAAAAIPAAASGAAAAAPNSNLLKHVLRATDPGSAAATDRNALTTAEMVGNVKTYMLAGSDTLGAGLSWLLYYVAAHADVQEGIRAELLTEMPGGGGGNSEGLGDTLTWDQIERLEYLDAVVQETMRVRPLVPNIWTQAERDTAVAGVAIARGDSVIVNLRKPCRLDANFTDAAAFWPERWLIADGKRAPPEGVADFRHNKVVGSFGFGPRNCPGQVLAVVEIKVAIAFLVRAFTIRLAPGQGPPKEYEGLAMAPDAVRLVLQRRQ
eukprot:TRINITY_DN121_c2_g1_i3.p1 TRINITY_DN121_c2_g1~~TRINITY_DN121_c2_g1_i3.p1  ORF type:complete len:493 (+),score=211.18 TRINITY_DN121_c2_g1_i3:317-1795(+)